MPKIIIASVFVIFLIFIGCSDENGEVSKQTVFSKLDVPLATQGSYAFGINNHGTIVGRYDDTNGTYGYTTTDKSTNFESINCPGATKTVVTDINDNGHIVGVYTDISGLKYAFYSTDNGKSCGEINCFEASKGTTAVSINNNNQIVGYYKNDSGYYGFLSTDGGKSCETITCKQFNFNTMAYGINDKGILYKSHGDFKKQDARLNNHTRWDNPTTSYVLQQYDSSDGWGIELLS